MVAYNIHMLSQETQVSLEKNKTLVFAGRQVNNWNVRN